jgi:hypothetical protein
MPNRLTSPIEQRRIKVVPAGIVFFDQPELPRPIPFLELLFARDRFKYVFVPLEPDEPMHAIASREPGDQVLAM